ncbi:MAG: carboxymuconolactone decarboxylase family protein [Desulfuromonadaceae bacterium]
MSLLTPREREFVAIGASLASNCVPCTEYHIQAARKLGISVAVIEEALAFADKIRRTPADKVLAVANSQLAAPVEEEKPAPAPCCSASQKSKTCC